MTGGGLQVEWAERIKITVAAEFDRFTRTFAQLADTPETATIIAVAKELRESVLANDDAGFYIRNWQDLGDQVRIMVLKDPRVQAIRSRKRSARTPACRIETRLDT